MDVTPLIRRDAKIIQSYKNGAFKISNEIYEASVIALHDRVLPWSPAAEISVEDFSALKGLEVELLLVGLPKNPAHPYRELRTAVKQLYGFAVEIMEIGAAARAYNALLADGRRVAVALRT